MEMNKIIVNDKISYAEQTRNFNSERSKIVGKFG